MNREMFEGHRFTVNDVVLDPYMDELLAETNMLIEKEPPFGRPPEQIAFVTKMGKIAETYVRDLFPGRFVRCTRENAEKYLKGTKHYSTIVEGYWKWMDLIDLEHKTVVEVKAWSKKTLAERGALTPKNLLTQKGCGHFKVMDYIVIFKSDGVNYQFHELVKM